MHDVFFVENILKKTTREACECCVFIIFACVVCLLLCYLNSDIWYEFPVRDRIRQANALIKGGMP